MFIVFTQLSPSRLIYNEVTNSNLIMSRPFPIKWNQNSWTPLSNGYMIKVPGGKNDGKVRRGTTLFTHNEIERRVVFRGQSLWTLRFSTSKGTRF